MRISAGSIERIVSEFTAVNFRMLAGLVWETNIVSRRMLRNKYHKIARRVRCPRFGL